MTKRLFILLLVFTSTIVLGQENLTIVFDFDSTKIYFKYSDILTVLKKENDQLKNKDNLIVTSDSLYLDRYFIYGKQTKDSSSFDLDGELFALINKQVGIIMFQNKIIKSFYTKSITHRRRHRKLFFKGIYYFDSETKKHFLTKTDYQRWYQVAW